MKKLFLVVFLCTAFLFMGTTGWAYTFGDPTLQGISPQLESGNPTFGSDYKIDPVYSDTFTFDGFEVTIEVVNDTTLGPYFKWWSDDNIDAIIVKGGPDANVYDYTSLTEYVHYDEFLHAPVNSSGKFAGLSHIEFAGTPSVPEPATLLLLGSGLVGLAMFGRKRFK